MLPPPPPPLPLVCVCLPAGDEVHRRSAELRPVSEHVLPAIDLTRGDASTGSDADDNDDTVDAADHDDGGVDAAGDDGDADGGHGAANGLVCCPAGHALILNTFEARFTAACDVCGAISTEQWCAGDCDYDLCAACFEAALAKQTPDADQNGAGQQGFSCVVM